MKQRHVLIIWLVVIGVIASAGSGWAAGIKERMRQRLPVIESLKANGIVGENNKGLLEFMKGKSENKEVVEAENKDRMMVYQAIAKKQGTTPELVGKRPRLADCRKGQRR